MTDLGDSFAKLIGRQPSNAERQQLYNVRDALDLHNNDALWLIIMALQHYQHMYDQFPQAIAQAAKTTLADFKVVADATMKASAEAAKADMAQAVAQTAREVARHVAGKEKLQWIAGCILTTSIAFCGFGLYLHYTGLESGFNSGYGTALSNAKVEKAALAWANTSEGKLAYQFAQTTNFKEVASCSRPGWKVENGYCFPLTDPKNLIYGWQMPK